jgi:hypothetical protein
MRKKRQYNLGIASGPASHFNYPIMPQHLEQILPATELHNLNGGPHTKIKTCTIFNCISEIMHIKYMSGIYDAYLIPTSSKMFQRRQLLNNMSPA